MSKKSSTLQKICLVSSIIAANLALVPSAAALNIVLTNDDGWDTENVRVLKEKLLEAGHDVILSAPCTQQSGKGGAINFLQPVNVDVSKASDDVYCVGDVDGDKNFDDYVEGTPVMAALYGIDVAAQNKWSAYPDLLISGPNEGNNVGFLNNNSGTLGAAMVALARGIPAIAVSGDSNSGSDSSQAPKIADIVVNIVDILVSKQKDGEPLLEQFTGLNINTPADLDNHLGYKFTDVGWNGGGIELKMSGDMSQDPIAMGYIAQGIYASGYVSTFEQAYALAQMEYAGQTGISFSMGDSGDDSSSSEGVAVKEGFITISTIDGNVQASSKKVGHTKSKLNSLINL